MVKLSKIKRLLRRHPRKTAMGGILLVVVVLLVASYLHHQHSSPVIPSTSPAKTVSGSSDKQVAASVNPSSSTSDSSKSAATSTTAPSGTPPTTPYGDFVSNHSPGGQNPTQETSVCNTTPGATCYIQFTQGSIIKSLSSQTADANGAAYWNWDATTLSGGSWTIKAIAGLNGQTATASDSRPLVVQ